MTGSSTPPPTPEPGPASEDVAALERELAIGDGNRLARYAARARSVARLLAVLVVTTGVAALLVGLAAWRETPIAMVVVVLLCLPAVVVPLYVARRTGSLAEAAARPKEMAHQTQDLISGVRNSAELRTLADRVTNRGTSQPTAVSARRPGRLRGAMQLAKLASTVVGQAQPDADRHPLLVPFTPERLARTWSAVVISLWAWLVAVLVLVVSVPALAISFF